MKPAAYAVMNAVLALPMRNGLAIDGGAHWGIWTKALTEKFGNVIAFEPNIESAEILEKNLNGTGGVTLIKKALGWVPEQKVKVMWRLNFKSDTSRISMDGQESIVTSLDSMGLQDVSFIKLDVEGFEYFALRGMEQTLLRCKPKLLIEEKEGLSEYYGIPTGEARRWLESIGMKVEQTFKIDVLLGWNGAA